MLCEIRVITVYWFMSKWLSDCCQTLIILQLDHGENKLLVFGEMTMYALYVHFFVLHQQAWLDIYSATWNNNIRVDV